ncbi:transcription factor IIIB 50 kDa subunit [Myripristis murdjan]|uniref:Transcription factor IIIB 50 kDa subunit n=1 Tax=Myripristis murdjan TaxID=586833 RepID=A0A668ADI2_9TELE|nr:transcription factor IIIB 50 kDa subunit [Myripristis murdjan]
MAPLGLTCPDCSSPNIVEDDLYSQPQLVCEDCGSVVSEGALTSDRGEGTDVSYRLTTAVSKQPCVNQIKGLQRVKAICRILRLNSEIEELAETYYKQAYEHRNFINVSLQKKDALVGCCVLVSCRLRNWPITMGTVSCLLDTDPMLVGVIYQEMVKTLNIEPHSQACIADVLEAHCQEYKISSPHVPEELAEDTKDITKRAVALVELAADSWIVTGRRPLPIMMATIFLAWQSLNPTKLRLKYTLERFCQLAKVTKTKPALKRITEIKEMLCKLGQEIPWLRGVVTPDNAIQQVEYILKYRYALLRRALRTHEDALMDAQQPSCKDFQPGIQSEEPSSKVAGPSQTSWPAEQTTNKSFEEASESNTENNQQPGDEQVNLCSTGAQVSQDLEPNWGKRLLFAPPCVKHPKIRRMDKPALKDVTGEEEISDSEIDSYIRSPQEVRAFALAKMMLCSSDKH